MIIVNFKNYVKGEKAIDLASKVRKFIPKVILCVRLEDASEISKPWLQKLPLSKVDEARRFGVKGTLLNHSDHPISNAKIKESIKACRKANIRTIVCVKSLRRAKEVLKMKPGAIAYEVPKLIGTGRSITKYKAGDVKEFAEMLDCSGSYSLCGAGISSAEDYKEAKKLGCKGVLVSSAIARSKKPEKLLRALSKV